MVYTLGSAFLGIYTRLPEFTATKRYSAVPKEASFDKPDFRLGQAAVKKNRKGKSSKLRAIMRCLREYSKARRTKIE